MSDAMAAEFDTVAAWTEEAVRHLGQDVAIPAGCRGSGSPANLAWLAEALELHRSDRMLDAGAGVGGPAAWLSDRFGIRPVCAEPMPDAVRASRRLFGLPAVVAVSQRLPFSSGSFDAAWALGVLCTTEDKPAMLEELHRVLAAKGRLGLLVFVADGAVDDPPAGNSFPSRAELSALLADAGFAETQEVAAAALPTTPFAWQARADRVDALIESRYGSEPAWREADDQSRRMGRLIGDGQVRAVLVHAVAS
jgi:SAM-dependent methyltransferase